MNFKYRSVTTDLNDTHIYAFDESAKSYSIRQVKLADTCYSTQASHNQHENNILHKYYKL